MRYHFHVSVMRTVGMFNANYFYLIELMQTIQPTYMRSIGTCFASKTWRIASNFNRKLFFIQNHISINIG